VAEVNHRTCTKGHKLIWLSIVGQCKACGQQFVMLNPDGPVACLKCGGEVKRTECSKTEPREIGESVSG
jgi:rRNA maturation endonuclease Nob1